MPTHSQSTTCHCPALMISAPSSGSGKTTITAALAAYHSAQGKKVQVFKTGPDFIDPMILEQASGHPVYQLDLWMVGEHGCQELLFEAAQVADLILIEGVMGLFDGTPSSADLSIFFNIPILAIIDGSAMAQTFGAVAYGLANYKSELQFYGVIANKIAGKRHGEMVLSSVPDNIPVADFFMRAPEIALAERHLGLVQAQELNDIADKLHLAASQIANTKFAQLPPEVRFLKPKQATKNNNQALAGKTIIIARDLAFNFLYRANIRLLENAGASIILCSPMKDKQLPKGDALYIPGGYPELYAQQISENTSFIASLQQFVKSGKPLLAECGGMLYLLDRLTTIDKQDFAMAKIISGNGLMKDKLSAIGQQYVDLSNLPQVTDSYNEQTIRGHSFHYSQANINLPVVATTKYYHYQTDGEAIYFSKNILASYMHWYFPSNPQFIFDFFNQKLHVQ